jgi:chemotaxis regulatin CheY-phosphate phosphatase CheZ
MPQPEKPALSEADFEAIAAAVNETERGRWFLAEYARRNRHADTERVLEAVTRLERSLSARTDAAPSDTIRSTIADMAEAIARTKAEIAAIRPSEDNFGTISNATIELDAIVSTTELATSEILANAERVQEIAWTMREQGLEPSFCDQLDGLMTQTYQACSFQDLTGQRIRKVVNVLHFLEERIEAMNLIWGGKDTRGLKAETPSMEASLLNGPALPGEGLEQIGVDEILDPEPAVCEPAVSEPAASEPVPEPAVIEPVVIEPAAARVAPGIPVAAETTIEAETIVEDIVWEDAPLEDNSREDNPREAAMEAAARLIADNLASPAAPLAPATPELEPQPKSVAKDAVKASPIDSLTPAEKLALFS